MRCVAGPLLVVVLAAPMAWSQVPAQPLRYLGDADFAPYEFLDGEGHPAGLNVELMREVARLEGFEVVFALVPWPQVQPALLEGRADLAAMYRSSERAALVDYAIPHEFVHHELYQRVGAPPMRGLGDLAGHRVAVQATTVVSAALQARACCAVLEFVSEPQALAAVARGEAEVAVVSQTVGRPFVQRAEYRGQLVASGPPVLPAEYAFVAPKGRQALLEQVNDGLFKLRASGDFDRVYGRWLRPDPSAGALRTVLLVLGAALALVGLVMVWNRALRRQVAAQGEALRREFEARERAQAALVESERSLRAAQKMEAIGRLASGVAHDFNNILGVIISYASFARDDLEAHGLPTEDVVEVLSAAERAARLTRQLLAFSRAAPMQRVQLDLGQVVVGMRQLVQRLVSEAVSVAVQVPDHPVRVEAEPTLVEQMVLNLAANARDAMPGGGSLAITVDERILGADASSKLAPGRYATLTVTDDGVGMDDATRARIFEPFFTTKAEGQGTGLGLSIVFANTTRLGGQVTVESAPGKGTSFTIFLPVAAAQPASAGAAVEPVVKGAGKRVLLVEDYEPLRRASRVALARAGFEVLEAESARAALACPTPDVLVTDVVLPRTSGLELAAELRKRHPHLPVLFVSANAGPGALAEGAPRTGFLAKPFTAPALVGAVARVLEDEGPPRAG